LPILGYGDKKIKRGRGREDRRRRKEGRQEGRKEGRKKGKGIV
jgi:hypothetical protein